MAAHPETDLGVYVLGVLPGAESTSLRMHLETCAECRARVGDLEGISELLSAARLVPDPPPGLVETALTSLPPRRPPPDPRPPAPGGGTVGGDFVLTPPEPPPLRARRGRLYVGACVAVLAAAAALAWALAATGEGDTIELDPAEATASGHVRLADDGAGSALVLHTTGLAAGDYSVELDGTPAGSFHASDGLADVDLHAAASAGHLVVLREGDGSVVLEADLP